MGFKNTDVFSVDGYDMVVAVTEAALNAQIKHLAHPDIGVIKTEITLQIVRDEKGDYKLIFYKDWDSVPKNKKGWPKEATITGTYMPGTGIPETGSKADLQLEFLSGTCYLIDSIMRDWIKYDMTGWSFSAEIKLGLIQVNDNSIDNGIAAPESVAREIKAFTSNDFLVSRLFLNFVDSDLIGGSSKVLTPGAGKSVGDAFRTFVANWFEALDKDPLKNPWVLGYSVINTPKTQDPDKDVPDMFKPWRATFSLYKDKDANRSLLNWVILTAANKYKEVRSPQNFLESWLAPDDVCDGKIIYSKTFLRKSILEAFYSQYVIATHQTVQKKLREMEYIDQWLNVNDIRANSFADAMTTFPGGAKFYICRFRRESPTTDDSVEYTNEYTAKWETSGSTVTITLSGKLWIRIDRRKNMWTCYAKSAASATKYWSTSITIESMPDAKGRPSLKVSEPIVKDENSPPPGEWADTCAKGWGTIAEIFGAILDFLTGFKYDFGDMFKDWFVADVGGAIPPKIYLGEVFPEAKSKFLLPAGDVFFFKNPAIIEDECFSSQLTFKAEQPTLKASKNNFHVVSDIISCVVAPNPPSHTLKNMPSPTFQVATVSNPKLKRETIAFLEKQQLASDKAKRGLPKSATVPLGAAMKDKLTLKNASRFKTNAVQQPDINVSVSCELMKNSHASLPVSPGRDFKVVQDHLGQLLVFAMAENNEFNVLMSSPGLTNSGFTVINLLNTFVSGTKIEAFDVCQDSKGRISMAFTISETLQNPVTTKLFYIWLKPSKDIEMICRDLKSYAEEIGGLDPQLTQTRVRLGQSADNERPMLTVEGKANGDHLFYQLQSMETMFSKYSLPINVDRPGDKLISLRNGFNFGQRANYLLYETAGVKTCVVITVADESQDSLTYDYSPSALPEPFQSLEYNSIQTAISRDAEAMGGAASDIYLCCRSGLYRIPNGSTKWTESVTETIPNVHDLSISIEGSNISLWALSGGNSLWYINGTRVSTGSDRHAVKWKAPVRFASNALAVTTMLSTAESRYNELLVLTQDNKVDHYWQATEGGFWRSMTVTLPKSKVVLQENSYTSHIHFESQNVPLVGAKLGIASSEWQYCVINGKMFSLDQDTFAEVETDLDGNITIIGSASDMSPPVIHLNGESFMEQVDIYPEGKIKKHLDGIEDGTQLLNARDQANEMVVTEPLTQDTADGFIAVVNELKADVNETYPPADQGRIFTAIHSAEEAKHHRKKPMKPMRLKRRGHSRRRPKGSCFGLRVHPHGWKLLQEDRMENIYGGDVSLWPTWEDVKGWAGDFWEGLKHFGGLVLERMKDTALELKNGITILFRKLEEGFEMLLDIAGKGFRLLLNGLKEVFKGISFLLSLIGIDTGKILGWLGHLMGWDNVYDTAMIYSKMMTNAVDFMITETGTYIDKAKDEISGAFDGLDEMIRNALLPEDIKRGTVAGEGSKKTNGLDTESPQGGYVLYHLKYSTGWDSGGGGVASKQAATIQNGTHKGIDNRNAYGELVITNGHIEEVDVIIEESGDPMTQFMDDVVFPILSTVKTKLGEDAEALMRLLRDTSLENVLRLIVSLVTTVTDTIESLIIGVLNFIKDIIKDIGEALKGEVEIPFFTDLWNWVFDLFDEKVPFTAINACSFLFSIMSCTTLKILDQATPNKVNLAGCTDPGFLAGVLSEMPSARGKGMRKFKAEELHELSANNGVVMWSWISSMISAYGGIVMNVMSSFRAGLDSIPVKGFQQLMFGLAISKGVFSFPMPKPVITGTWYFRLFAWAVSSGWRWLTEFVQLADTGKFQAIRGKAGKLMRDTMGAVMAFVNLALSLGVNTYDGAVVEVWISDVGGNTAGLAAGMFAALGYKPGQAAALVVAALCSWVSIYASVNNFTKGEVTHLFHVGGI